jgi:hypothetical protein
MKMIMECFMSLLVLAFLRHHPAVINKIARVTIMPKSGNKDKIRDYYWNLISHMMNDNKIDVIAIIMD